MKKFLKYIKIPAFFAGLFFVMLVILNIFTVNHNIARQSLKGFYQEDTKLDAVYIGSSSTYTFWQAPVAWEKFGITVYPLTTPSMTCPSLKYMIEEARKTQPDALYIISLNTFKKDKSSVERVHYAADNMPLSRNKIDMINDLCSTFGVTGTDTLEYYLPFIRFHSGWNELTEAAFYHPPEGMKGAVDYYSFLQKSSDLSAENVQTKELADLTDGQDAVLNDLLQYCRDNELKVLFVVVPQTGKTLELLGQFNTLSQRVQDAGYPVLNLSNSMEEIGLDPSCDYYNSGHVNIHGCAKYVDYLGAYLQEQYGFADKRGDPAYASWDEAVEIYTEIIGAYTLDVERGPYERDLSLGRPTLTGAAVNGTEVTVTWEPAENTSDGGVVVYRRTKDGVWTRLAEVSDGAASYTDGDTAANTKYIYTVIPVRYEDGQAYYGNYDYAGISAKTGEADKAT